MRIEYDEQGRRYEVVVDDDDDSDILPDGGVLSVRMPLMDERAKETVRVLKDNKDGHTPSTPDGKIIAAQRQQQQRDIADLSHHRAGFRFYSPAQRQRLNEARVKYLDRLTSAWNKPPPAPVTDSKREARSTSADEAYQRRCQALRDAWRHP
jgi:hypothetical protein